ncbi:uncharacterized protein LOC123556881 [Mercenaria mercenaria]|uniref:uncharacterized protein LOC123556881 n=1 Tax=Mercenaria mercenaria TaxID=6596 RepID=UPI00234E5184|nr:uncharacterized protein LOC123556881 [Mercenaria mercenaria]
MTHISQVENQRYRNWVKSGLGLKYLKKGLEKFAEEVVKEQHTNILYNIKQFKQLPLVDCDKCNTTTIEPDHVRTKSNHCPLGCNDCNCKHPRGKTPCPQYVCGAIYDQIITFHGSTPPCPYWRNTNSSLWCTNPWEMAKCFINSPGYENCTSAVDTDCAGLLHLIINNKAFHSHLDCSISNSDIFSMARQNRNEILHSPKMELENEDVERHIDNMIAVLQDPKELVARPEAIEAVENLTKLKTAEFVITSQNETEILQERELIQKLEDVKTVLADAIKHNVLALSAVKGEQANGQTTETRKITDFSTNKKEFQKRLISLYMDNGFVKVSATPLQPERDNININDVYVEPWMTKQRQINARTKGQIGKHGRTGQGGKDGVSEHFITDNISSFKELFSIDDQRMRLIYVLGEAGTGKSSFCKHMVYTWCQAHSKPSSQLSDNEKEMKKFEFLFLISLRHHRCDMDIKSMLYTQYDDSMLNDILKYESSKCIVLLDGLDEWPLPPASPHQGCQAQTMGLPRRDLSKQYTVITTSRSSKYELLNIRDSEHDLVVQLRGIDDYSAERMSALLISNLNETQQVKRNEIEFFQLLHSNVTLKEFINVPVMLQQLLCLWFDGKDLNSSRCEIYSSMLEFLFEREWQRNPSDGYMRYTNEICEADSYTLPQNFENKARCQELKHCIYLAGKIAYTTLFSECKESRLSFDKSVLTDIEHVDDVVKSCLSVGILTEERCVSLSLSKPSRTSLSFIHKCVQEFLASVYITMRCGNENVSSKSVKQFREDQKGKDEINHSECILNYFQGCKTLGDVLELSNVMILLSGLVQSGCMQITKYILDVTNGNNMVVGYRLTTQEYHKCRIVKEIQNIVSACVKESGLQETHISDLTNRSHVTTSLGDSDSHRKQSDNEDKRFLLGDLIIINASDLKLLQNIKTDKVISLFYATNRTDLSMCVGFKVQKLYILLAEIPEQDVKTLCTITKESSSSLKSISVEKAYYTPDEPLYVTLYDTLIDCLNRMKQLVAIQVEGFKLSHQHCNTFAKFLKKSKYLHEIFVQHIHCENGYCKTHKISLPKHENLKKLSLNNSNITIDSFNTNSLEMCDIGGIDKDFPVCLKSAQLLEQFKFSSISSDDSSITFPSMQENLKHVILESIMMKTEAWSEFANSLGQLNSLETLQLDYSNIPPEALERVFEHLRHYSSLRHLYLGGVELTRSHCFTFMLRMDHLENINLSCIIMSQEAWANLVDCLLKVSYRLAVHTFRLKIEAEDRLTFRQCIKGRRDAFRVKYEKDDSFDFEKV